MIRAPEIATIAFNSRSLRYTTLLKAFWPRLSAGVGCLCLLAGCTAAYAFLTGPFLQVMLSGGKQGLGYFNTLTLWMMVTVGDSPFNRLWAVALVIAVVAALKGVAQLGQARFLDGTVEMIGFDLRARLYQHLLKLPLSYHRQYNLGDLLTHLIDDVRQAQNALVLPIIAVVREALSILALLGVAIWMVPRMALYAAIVLPLAGLIIGFFSKGIKRASEKHQQSLSLLSSRAAQGLSAIREIKSCEAEVRESAAFGKRCSITLKWALRRITVRMIAPLLNEVLAALALGGLLLYAALSIQRGDVTPERFISFITAVLLMYRPIKELGKAYHLAVSGKTSLERLNHLLQISEEAGPSQGGLLPLKRSYALRDIHFQYESGKPILEGVNLELNMGSIVALAGPSGSGKSTLASIVCGLERPDSGQIIWDGQDISDRTTSDVRSQAAYVPQQPLLLNASVSENLRLGHPRATERELQEAMKMVGLHEMIASLPSGYRTKIGPGGIGLSVGEIQRLAIARAILRRKSLLVLDEPSSALDSQSEQRVVRVLKDLAKTRAVLIVAHNDALLTVADQVIDLETERRKDLLKQDIAMV